MGNYITGAPTTASKSKFEKKSKFDKVESKHEEKPNLNNENKYEEKKYELDSDSDSDDAYQEAIVNDKDERKEAYKFKIENTNIRYCIGKLICKFMDTNNNKITERGTATVFKVINGYAYIITCAHNLRKNIYTCTKCNKRNNSQKCSTCGTKEFSKIHILKANKIYFERRDIKSAEFAETYNCDMNDIDLNDISYERFPFPTAGYDIAVLKFKDDGYYKEKCKNIILVDGKLFHNIKNKAIPYYIFGFPGYINDKENHQLWGGESIKDEFICKRYKQQRFFLKQYEIDTSVGTSGAAIFAVVKGPGNVFYTIIFAVHTGGIYKKYNAGTLVDKNIDYLKVINANPIHIKSVDELIADSIERMNKFLNIEYMLNKTMSEWSVTEILTYLNCAVGLKKNEVSTLIEACSYLRELAENDDKWEEILQYEAVDILFNVIQDITVIKVQMMACLAVYGLYLKAGTNGKSTLYTSNVNGIYEICKAIKLNSSNPNFVICALYAVRFFCCHGKNKVHIAMLFKTNLIDQVLYVMDYYCQKNKDEKVYEAVIQMLSLVVLDDDATVAIGTKGVKSVINGVRMYKNVNTIVEKSLKLLQVLVYHPPHAICAATSGAIDMICVVMKNTTVDSSLFLQALETLITIVGKLPNQNKQKVVQSLIAGKGLLSKFSEAIKYNSKDLHQWITCILSEITDTSTSFAQQVADFDFPVKIIKICIDNPNDWTLVYAMKIWSDVCDVSINQEKLIKNGIVEFLISHWYKNNNDICQNYTLDDACYVYIKLLSNKKNALKFSKYRKEVLEFCNYCRQNKSELVGKIAVIESLIKATK